MPFRHRLDFHNILFEEVKHRLGALKDILLRYLVEAFESLDEMLLLVVRESLDDINHQNSISAVTQART